MISLHDLPGTLAALLVDVLKAAASLAVFLIAGLVTVVVYRIWLHPLARVPGPWPAKVSNAWFAWQVRKGRGRILGKTLHERYGRVVRVGVDEVWVDDEAGWRGVYGGGSGSFDKSDFYLATVLNKPTIDRCLDLHFPDTLDLLSEFDMKRYRLQRRLIGPVYQASNLKRFEGAVDEVMKKAVGQLKRLGGKEVDVKQWMHILVVECLGAVVLSWSPGYIKDMSDGGTSAQSYMGWKRKSVFGLFPKVTTVAFFSKAVGRMWSNLWGVTFPTPKNFKPFFTPVYQKSSKRITAALREPTPPTKPSKKPAKRAAADERKDLLTDLIQLHKDKPEFTEHYLRRMAMTNFGAGHETMCSALTSIMTCLGSNPEVQKRAAAEVRNGDNGDDRSYPYLQACIKEAMRLYPVIGMSLPRTVPSPAGFTIHGHHLPGGTTVGCNPVALHRNKDIFGDDADRFNPDRWLPVLDDEDATERIRKMERCNLIWGGGARTCPGRNLAEMILQRAVAGLLREFNVVVTKMPAEEEMPMYFMAMMTGVRGRFEPRP